MGAAFCPTVEETGAVLLRQAPEKVGGSFGGRPPDDLSLLPGRPEAPQGSSRLDHYVNAFFTTEAWCLWAGAALANNTELMGTIGTEARC